MHFFWFSVEATAATAVPTFVKCHVTFSLGCLLLLLVNVLLYDTRHVMIYTNFFINF